MTDNSCYYMELTANIVGKTRYETRNGKRYLVAPLSLIVPGVLNGSKGPLYYPSEETARNYKDWNDIPLVAYHPLSANGDHVSAHDPQILSRQGIGFVSRPRITRQGKLAAEGWFDVESTKRVDNRILHALESGQPVELSTGLYTDNEEAPVGSEYNGRQYTHVARNYRPDHVAVLPDQVGACSIADGCGVLVNQATKVTPGEYVVISTQGGTTSNAGINQPRHSETGRYLHHGAGTGKGPVHGAARDGYGNTDAAPGGSVPVGSTRTTTDIRGSLLDTSGSNTFTSATEDEYDDYVPKRRDISPIDWALGSTAKEQKKGNQVAQITGHNPASWVADEDVWEKAKKAASKTYDEDEDAYWPAVVTIYKKMGGVVKDKTDNSNPQVINQYTYGTLVRVKPTATFKGARHPRAGTPGHIIQHDTKTGVAVIGIEDGKQIKVKASDLEEHDVRPQGEVNPVRGMSSMDARNHFTKLKESGDRKTAKKFLEDVEPHKGASLVREIASDHGIPIEVNPGGKGMDMATTSIIIDRILNKTHPVANANQTSWTLNAMTPLQAANKAKRASDKASSVHDDDFDDQEGLNPSEATDATQKALKQSTKADDPNSHTEAAKSHIDASEAHKSLAEAYAKAGREDIAEAHGNVSDAHRDAALAHVEEAHTGAYGVGGSTRSSQGSTRNAAAGINMDPAQKAHLLSDAADQATRSAKDKETHKVAMEAHQDAAKAHRDLSKSGTDPDEDGDPFSNDFSKQAHHNNKADYHDAKAMEHGVKCGEPPDEDSTNNVGSSMFIANDFASDDQRKAFSAKLAESGHAESEAAGKASQKAERSGLKQDHLAATKAHREARDIHEEGGNDTEAEQHALAAKYHAAKAGGSSTIPRVHNMFSQDQRKTIVDKLVANCSCQSANVWNEGDRNFLMAMNDDQLQRLLVGRQALMAAGGGAVSSSSSSPTMNAGMTEEQWLAAAPVSIRNAVNYAKTVEQQRKSQLVGQLLVNVADPMDRQNKFQKYMQRDLVELEELVSLLPSQPRVIQNAGGDPLYMGANAAFGLMTSNTNEQDATDILPLPKMDYSRASEGR